MFEALLEPGFWHSLWSGALVVYRELRFVIFSWRKEDFSWCGSNCSTLPGLSSALPCAVLSSWSQTLPPLISWHMLLYWAHLEVLLILLFPRDWAKRDAQVGMGMYLCVSEGDQLTVCSVEDSLSSPALTDIGDMGISQSCSQGPQEGPCSDPIVLTLMSQANKSKRVLASCIGLSPPTPLSYALFSDL